MSLFPLFIFGLFIGSFLNVLIDRLPREESVIKGRSHCEYCKHKLAWFDLVPLLSFVQLQGKCRYCGVSLSLYYPISEITTGVLFVMTGIFVSNNFQFLIVNFQSNFNLQLSNVISLSYFLYLISSLIVIFFIDLKFGIIPDNILFPTVFLSLPYVFIIHNSLFVIHLLSAFGAFLFFFLLHVLTRGRGMGFGDVKFVVLMGLVLGFPGIVIGLYIAFLTGAIVSLILIVWGKKKLRGSIIPFGPFLVIGMLAALFWGDMLLRLVLHLLNFSLL